MNRGRKLKNDEQKQYYKRLGEFLYKARIEKGISQADLAHYLGLTVMMVLRFEKGCSVPDLSTLREIARALDINPAKFFDI